MNQVLLKAKSYTQKGDIEEAQKLYQAVLKAFPKHKRARQGLTALNESKQSSATHGLPQESINQLINLYNQGKLAAVVDRATMLTEKYPKSFMVWNILGGANKGLNRVGEASEAFKKVTELNPNYADGYNNLGVALKDQGRLEEAIMAFNKALILKADYAEAHCNMGNALYDQGKRDGAIKAYKKALLLKPDYAEAHNNMGNALRDQVKLEEAIVAFNKALSLKPDFVAAYNNLGAALENQGHLEKAIAALNEALRLKPDYSEAKENLSSLRNQLLGTPLVNERLIEELNTNDCDLPKSPKFQIHQAIYALLSANSSSVLKHLENYDRCDPALFTELTRRDQIFCLAYRNFLYNLVKSQLLMEPASVNDRPLFHLGESHCLSYAHQKIKIQNLYYKIIPKITFGGKAFHFSREKKDVYKEITKANFNSLPDGSKVLVSFGEIDCRPDEGLITAAKKLNKHTNELITQVVKGYFTWFARQNKRKNHHLFFFTVPAPIYDKKLSPEINSEVAATVIKFNNAMKENATKSNFDLIDVHKLTVADNAFSNSKLHIDKRHLGPSAILQFQGQLN